jgi:hypothetical protein
MSAFGINFTVKKSDKLLNKVVAWFRRIITGVSDETIIKNVLEDSKKTLAKHISNQIGRSVTDVSSTIFIQRNSIIVEDEPRSLATAITATTGRGLITRQGKRQITWKAARVVKFDSGTGMIAYYAKGHKPRQRNPRKFGEKGNAYIKYAVTTDQAASAIAKPNAPEKFLESVTKDFEKKLYRVLSYD